MTDITPYILNCEADLREGLSRLNRLSGPGGMTLFVTDADGRAIGTLTDGDIRRALIAGAELSDPVTVACHREFRALSPGDPAVEALRRFRRAGITLVPVIDDGGRIVRLVDLSRTHTILPVRALIMAGGKGERLRPMTLTTPKPLLEIEGKAIIDYNIRALADCGVTDITVSTGYLAEKLERHFARPVCGVRVKTVRESSPLGTIGAATLMAPDPDGRPVLVMNSDLITTISFEEMYLRHIETGADITVAVIPYQVSVPYAILQFDSDDPDRVTGLEEKPAYSYYANAGIYLFSPQVLATLRPDTRTDATDLIEATIAAGGLVTHYPVGGTWIDVGSPTDFRQAAELIRHHNSMTPSTF